MFIIRIIYLNFSANYNSYVLLLEIVEIVYDDFGANNIYCIYFGSILVQIDYSCLFMDYLRFDNGSSFFIIYKR